MRPHDLPSVAVLAARKPHGSRVKYMGGCKCMLCRAANSRYETERAARRRMGLWNGLVSARKSRNHMLALSRQGVGRRTVSKITGISDTILFNIRSGTQLQVRALTEKAILEVTKYSVRGSTLVPAGSTWKKIAWLMNEGFTKRAIAKMLGSKSKNPALKLKRDKVTAFNARKIEEIYRRYV